MSIELRKNAFDGEWFCSDHEYKNYKLEIKMRSMHGSKIHIWKDSKVIKTFRYSFATPTFLLEKARKFIDKREGPVA